MKPCKKKKKYKLKIVACSRVKGPGRRPPKAAVPPGADGGAKHPKGVGAPLWPHSLCVQAPTRSPRLETLWGGDTSFPAPLRARPACTGCPLRGHQQGGVGKKSLSVGQRAAPLSATGHWVSWERCGSTPQAGESRPRGSRSLPASPRPQNAGHTRPAPKKRDPRGKGQHAAKFS